MAEEVKRSFYPGGVLQAESRFAHGKFQGMQRTWHPNGVLASEVPFERGLQHGACRFWNQKAELLGENEMVYGTGGARIWFENGRLKSEGHLKGGVPHGRLRAWDESGKLISESYWIDGRKVSKRKYAETCLTDETLPRYESEHRAPVGTRKRAKEPAKPLTPTDEERRIHKETVEKLLKSEKAEALAWLRGSSEKLTRTIGQLGTTEASMRLVEEAYAAGAKEVIAVDITPPFEGEQRTDKLLLAMPEQPEAHRKLFAWANEQAEYDGYDPESDWGQQHLLVWFD